jgi:hypothetical protein
LVSRDLALDHAQSLDVGELGAPHLGACDPLQLVETHRSSTTAAQSNRSSGGDFSRSGRCRAELAQAPIIAAVGMATLLDRGTDVNGRRSFALPVPPQTPGLDRLRR